MNASKAIVSVCSAIGLLGGTAYALPVEWSPVVNGQIEVDVNTGAIVQLKSAGAGAVRSMDLFITVPDVVMLSEGTTIGPVGSGWLFTYEVTVNETVDFTDVSGGFRHGQMYQSSDETVQATPGAILAQFKVTVPAGTPVGTEFWLENTWEGAQGALGGDMPIVGVTLKVVPEPASALLILVGLPLLRRRLGFCDASRDATRV